MLDIDECLEGVFCCYFNVECLNIIGFFMCRCNVGLVGNGKICLSKER